MAVGDVFCQTAAGQTAAGPPIGDFQPDWQCLCGVRVFAVMDGGNIGAGALVGGVCKWRLACLDRGGWTLDAGQGPHFLFNTLNSAIALVRSEPAKAETLLEDLSDLFRQALKGNSEAVTLAQEIDLAQRYLAIEQIRFGDRLRVRWDIDETANTARLPALVLQPLVENAVRHGVEPSASGADVQVSARRKGAVVVIKVTNTVPSGQGDAGHGVALRNVKERIALLHDVHGQVVSGFKNGLFQVRLEVPL
jgi:two-component system sensor histidine kinase AlgZ